jgi:hypothetical protein
VSRSPMRPRGRVEHTRRGPRRHTPAGADIDPIAVERAVAGDRSVVLSGWERDCAIWTLDGTLPSTWALARHLGVCDRTVHRSRQRRAMLVRYLALCLTAQRIGATTCP